MAPGDGLLPADLIVFNAGNNQRIDFREVTARQFEDLWRVGCFGGFLVGFTQDLAPRDKVLRSYELMARYVMPHFQGSLAGLHVSNQWARTRSDTTRESMSQAVDRARQAYQERRGGAR